MSCEPEFHVGVVETRMQVARTMLDRAMMRGHLSRTEQLVANNAFLTRFGDAPEPAIRDLVAQAMFSRVVLLGALRTLRPEEEQVAYKAFVTKFGDATEGLIRTMVSVAMSHRVQILVQRQRYQEALVVLDADSRPDRCAVDETASTSALISSLAALNRQSTTSCIRP